MRLRGYVLNKKRREIIQSASRLISDAREKISTAYDAEYECLSNMPENLESSDRYIKMENAVDSLEDADDYLDDAMDSLDKALDCLSDASA